ncbi:unnamed protein product [Adineta steineri]|uniref:Uncharacterized protein n=1 Tax=Adineta steineri TaxID=433720 RepID=A0A814LGY8_9BILA|nr:unnamed protein product [Adineta steineri]CAF1065130.1 unnamed protein product [Adineta steineri]CAF1067929.1 unnamed protein product [Adineta steineri]CAF3789788.1 unnamed protein product [Adineta steineri]CAF3951005.1 unnamed protein product [Adineta steineri]
MGRYYKTTSTCDIRAIGIKGDLNSLCGAIKRFQRHGIQSNDLLSLKELCARRIALIKNKQVRWFITAYLPPHLFKYVTNDIFDLRRDEFKLNYAKDFDMCDACSIDDYQQRTSMKCRCPKVEGVIRKLNNYFTRRMNNNKKKTKKDQTRKFELIYKMPNGEEEIFMHENLEPQFFLYLSPAEYFDEDSTTEEDDMDGSISCQTYKFLKGQISTEDKILFVDVMRFIGAFRINHDQPALISYHRQEVTSDM